MAPEPRGFRQQRGFMMQYPPFPLLLVALASLATAACDSGGGKSAHHAGSALSRVAVVYPGATVVTESQNAAKGSRVTVLSSPDPIERIADFYDRAAQSAGFDARSRSSDEDGAVLAYKNADEALTIAVSRDDDSDDSRIVIASRGVGRARASRDDDSAREKPMPKMMGPLQ